MTIALTAPPARGAELDAIVFPVTINSVARGEMPIVLRDGDVLMRRLDLESSGLTGPMWERLTIVSRLTGTVDTINGSDAVSLRSLAPWTKYEIDEANLSVSITVDPMLLTSTAVTLQVGRPDNLEYAADRSTFFNYALSTTDGLESPAFFGELGYSTRGLLFYNTFSGSEETGFSRGLTSLIRDDRENLRRYTFGDATYTTDVLGGAGLIGGVSISKNFALDPYFVRYPSFRLQGAALTPSVVDVYVNGTLISQQQVPPGPFELRNIPLTGGAGTTQFVVRDVFGNARTESYAFYYSTGVLARGLNEYNYSAGFRREGFGADSFDYSKPVLAGFHRRGITDDLTLGARAEVAERLWSGGPAAVFQSPFGDTEVALAASSDRGHSGTAGTLSHRYVTRRGSVGGSVRLTSREYATTSLPFDLDRALADATIFGSLLFARSSLTALVSVLDQRDTPDSKRAAVQASYLLNRFANLFLSAGLAEVGGVREPEYSAGVGIFLGRSTATTIGVSHRKGRTQSTVDLQRSLPVGTGFGYRLQAENGTGASSGNGALQYQTGFGRYEAAFSGFDGDLPSLSASGGLVYQRGNLLFTRAVQDSFALVRVPGVPNVRVYSNNLEVGRTDKDGELILPSLLSYYGNKVRIEDRDIPMEFSVPAVERTIAPPFRGGALVEFAVRRITTVTGTVAVRNGDQLVIPAYGQLTVTGSGMTLISPLGNAAEFYLENIPAGTYSAAVDYATGTCTFSLVVPETAENFIKMGQLACAAAENLKP